MKLSMEQISEAARGVAYVSEEEGLVRLHRFTEEQEQLYERVGAEHYFRSFATAGVVLEFDTDSESLLLDVRVSKGSSRRWFAHSVLVNGKSVGTLGGTHPDGGHGDFVGSWSLGQGEKRVKLLFPWGVYSRIRRLELSDGAAFQPVKKSRKVLIYGDSITHGYDATVPERSYASQLADYLDGDCINKAIGGEVFRPALSEFPDPIQPELITVAYGTNDWPRRPVEELGENARAFLAGLRKAYPNAKIVVFAPIWRRISNELRFDKPFGVIAECLKEIVAEMDNASFIDCFDFVPHDLDYYAADGTHPNDRGFACYAEGVIRALKELGI